MRAKTMLLKILWGMFFFHIVMTLFFIKNINTEMAIHYDISGKADKYGSKYTLLLYPAFNLIGTAFWSLLIWIYQKKGKKAKNEKELVEVENNRTVLAIVGIINSALFASLQVVAVVNATNIESRSYINAHRISGILLGIMLVILGNVLPKTERNSLVGFRVKWTLFNDTTWKKSNCFAAWSSIFTGMIIIIFSITLEGILIPLLCVGVLIVWVMVCLIISKRIYDKEINK